MHARDLTFPYHTKALIIQMLETALYSAGSYSFWADSLVLLGDSYLPFSCRHSCMEPLFTGLPKWRLKRRRKSWKLVSCSNLQHSQAYKNIHRNYFNLYAAGGKFGKYRIRKWLKPWHMGTHIRVLSESYPMNTNMTGFRWFSKIFVSKVGSTLEGLTHMFP